MSVFLYFECIGGSKNFFSFKVFILFFLYAFYCLGPFCLFFIIFAFFSEIFNLLFWLWHFTQLINKYFETNNLIIQFSVESES